MAMGRRRPESDPEREPGVSISDTNTTPLQNAVGQNISHVYQSVPVQGGVDVEVVRSLLASFRLDVDRYFAVLPNADLLRIMVEGLESGLIGPDAEAGQLRAIVQALPALVSGTVVQQGGEALAHAIGALLNGDFVQLNPRGHKPPGPLSDPDDDEWPEES
ncbi:hypothetical protein [Streptomyces sp. NPDC050564]|uniref:hypothetical protein n=1 Tax=Streptomyces sp. NPDC050564 TaxID=3365631 RepID=UPI00379C8FFC